MTSKNQSLLNEISPKLTEASLTEFLKVYSGNNDVKLVNYELEERSACGDSYLSTVTRIKVEGLSKDKKKYVLPLIVKGLPANIGRRKTFKSTIFFRNEAAFYNEVLPRMLTFQEERKPKNPLIEIPRCYQALADGENDFIIMEDLSHAGFATTVRQEGFDYDHCCILLQLFGKFHALSLAMQDQNLEEFKKMVSSLEETYYSAKNKLWYEDQMHKLIDIGLDAVSKELPDSIYEEKYRNLTDNGLYDRMVELVKGKEPYSVIGHGDAWSPNFLFLHNKCDGKVESVRMIDFQLSRYGSPALDISFLLYSCTDKKLRDAHYDELLQVYYKSLCEFLLDLGSSPESVFPYKAFQSDIAAHFVFGFGMCLESVVFSLMDDDEAPDLDKIQGDEAVPITAIWIVRPIKTKQGRLRITDNLQHLVDNGYF